MAVVDGHAHEVESGKGCVMNQLLRRMAGLVALMASVVPSGCFGGMNIESEPGPGYVIEVRNPLPEPMIVSYDDGTGNRLLGVVAADASGRFVITSPADLNVTVTAIDEARTRTLTRSVRLAAGRPTEVVLSP